MENSELAELARQWKDLQDEIARLTAQAREIEEKMADEVLARKKTVVLAGVRMTFSAGRGRYRYDDFVLRAVPAPSERTKIIAEFTKTEIQWGKLADTLVERDPSLRAVLEEYYVPPEPGSDTVRFKVVGE